MGFKWLLSYNKIKRLQFMEFQELKKKLSENNLTLKKLSALSGVSYNTCTKWGKDNRPVSDWVESWLSMYIENQRLKKIEDMIINICKEQTLNTEK